MTERPRRRRRHWAWTALAAAAICGWRCSAAAGPEPTPEPAALPGDFDGAKALEHIETQVGFGPRYVGAPGHAQTIEWLRQTLTDAGYAATLVPFELAATTTTGRNVVGHAGSGPAIMLGTHFDTRLIADNDPDPMQRDQPPLGANDGASGVAVLLELARVLDLDATGHTVCLAFFDAEDNGRIPGWEWVLGSSYLADHPETVPACAEPRAVVVVDMVGDVEQAIYRDLSGTRALQAALFDTAAELGLDDYLIDEPRYDILDDHRPFAANGIPATVLIDFEYAGWHTTSDDLDRVGAEPLARVGWTLEAWLEAGAAF